MGGMGLIFTPVLLVTRLLEAIQACLGLRMTTTSWTQGTSKQSC